MDLETAKRLHSIAVKTYERLLDGGVSFHGTTAGGIQSQVARTGIDKAAAEIARLEAVIARLAGAGSVLV